MMVVMRRMDSGRGRSISRGWVEIDGIRIRIRVGGASLEGGEGGEEVLGVLVLVEDVVMVGVDGGRMG